MAHEVVTCARLTLRRRLQQAFFVVTSSLAPFVLDSMSTSFVGMDADSMSLVSMGFIICAKKRAPAAVRDCEAPSLRDAETTYTYDIRMCVCVCEVCAAKSRRMRGDE